MWDVQETNITHSLKATLQLTDAVRVLPVLPRQSTHRVFFAALTGSKRHSARLLLLPRQRNRKPGIMKIFFSLLAFREQNSDKYFSCDSSSTLIFFVH